MEEDWRRDLEHWLEPYLQKLGNKTRRRMTANGKFAGTIDHQESDTVALEKLKQLVG